MVVGFFSVSILKGFGIRVDILLLLLLLLDEMCSYGCPKPLKFLFYIVLVPAISIYYYYYFLNYLRRRGGGGRGRGRDRKTREHKTPWPESILIHPFAAAAITWLTLAMIASVWFSNSP